jgi:hypothetical protein
MDMLSIHMDSTHTDIQVEQKWNMYSAVAVVAGAGFAPGKVPAEQSLTAAGWKQAAAEWS